MSDIQDLPEWVRDNQAYYVNLNHNNDSADGVQKEKPKKANVGGSANVISSKLPSGDHTPMLDLDIGHQLIPSSTPGHSHLYLNTKLSHDLYRKLLVALWDAGIIQKGILDQFDEHDATFLRLPDVKKNDSGYTPWD